MVTLKRFSEAELHQSIEQSVSIALSEDIGTGDITALLIPASTQATAQIITREDGIFCGRAWADEVFHQLDSSIKIEWLVDDSDRLSPNQILCNLSGNARSLLTGERTALNFIQTLSGTATESFKFAEAVSGLSVKILDTRKTLPGLRLAQKYAVHCGGCHNHRIGLYDAFLIKENHIASAGSIANAINTARQIAPDKPIEIEVENLVQLQEAIDNQADIVMLDNFSLDDMNKAVALTQNRAKLEASGNMNLRTLIDVAATGVDFISIGALTKHCRALDLSMRIIETTH